MNITATYLRKKKRGRMINVNTLLMKGGDFREIEASCKNNEITGMQSIKSSEETGDEPNECGICSRAEDIHAYSEGLCRSPSEYEFVHVIKSVLDNYNKPIVVKIHDSVSYFVDKEIAALHKLSEFEHSVKKICDFSCMDDKARWKYMINSPIKFCNNKKDKLHFIALEYIENGDIDLFFSKNPSKETICSLFLQIEFAIMTLALDYKISHGDLHSGNILISSTEKSRIHYRVLGKEYRITSYGILPKLIDYGRSTNYKGKIYPSYILDDIYTCLSILVIYIRDEELKKKFQQFIVDESHTNTSDLHRILVETKKILS